MSSPFVINLNTSPIPEGYRGTGVLPSPLGMIAVYENDVLDNLINNRPVVKVKTLYYMGQKVKGMPGKVSFPLPLTLYPFPYFCQKSNSMLLESTRVAQSQDHTSPQYVTKAGGCQQFRNTKFVQNSRLRTR